MTSTTLALLLTSLLFNPSISTVSHHTNTKSTQIFQVDDEKALKSAWTQFAKAVVSGDKKMIKQLSASCVLCAESENPESAIINIDRFITEMGSSVFDANTKSRLLDSKKLVFHDNKQNKGLYRHSCISNLTEFKSAAIPEVLVTTIEESNRSGGMQKAFAFIKTKNGYKFCGYSTIP